MRLLSIILLSATLLGCESPTYYSMLETVGIKKSELLTGRVEDASKAQAKAKAEFTSALESLEQLTNFRGDDLEKAYKEIEKQYNASENAVNKVAESIEAMESVSTVLFKEWDSELNLYTNSGLRRESEGKFKETKLSYQQLISAMTKAENKMTPVLETLRDNMLYLKHNLNIAALEALGDELYDLKVDVERAIRDMDTAIEESASFIDNLNQRAPAA